MLDEELKATCYQGCRTAEAGWLQADHCTWRWEGNQQMGWQKPAWKPKFVNGLRVTDAETMEIAEMVLGKVE